MIGIYQDSFIDFLKEYLGEPIKQTSKNLIVRCPWCEMNSNNKHHFHMYISLDSPIFHCFFSECHKTGLISKLVKKIKGTDTSKDFIDETKIKEILSNRIEVSTEKIETRDFNIPSLDEDKFKLKSLYMKKRLRFSNSSLRSIKGLVFDTNSFFNKNKINLDYKIERMKDYLQTNFIGFCTENNSTFVLRNIDEQSDFRYLKVDLQDSLLSDYYKISGNNYNSNKIVFAEGIFDILLEHTFDSINIRNDCKLYAACLSTHYDSLLKSIVFHEQIFRPEVHILSDRGINMTYYEKIKKENKHLIDKLVVYYNLNGKDFADVPVKVEKFVF